MAIILDGTSGIANNATDLSYTGTLTGSTGIVNIGSGQLYKDASGNVGIGGAASRGILDIFGGRVNIRGNSSDSRAFITMGDATYTSATIAAAYGGDLTLTGYPVNLAAGQLKFPATQSASSDPNTLDDYEEGTWTPSLMTGSTQPTFTYPSRGGTYVKIGRQVIAWFYALVSVSSAGNAQAAVVASSLPFAPRSNSLTDSAGSRGGFVTQNPQSLNNTALTWNSANPSTADVLYFTTITGGSTTSGLASGTYAGYVMYEAA
jgi:hypothetical protein